MRYIILILLLLALISALQFILTRRLIAIGNGLAAEAEVYTREHPRELQRILIIGDSTAVGVGASKPEDSIAGRVGALFPNASIENLGVNGAKTHELIPRLEALEGNRYDLIMVHIGGNDIVRRTDLSELAESIDRVLTLAISLSDNVTLTTTGSLGTSKLLPLGTRWWFKNRTLEVRKIFIPAAEKHGVLYNDLFREPSNDPYAQNPKKYYAADLFHPSSDGYADWFSIISKSLNNINL